ncbi:hypothetical protein DM02DRAFT_625013 [Periconia macrospinosa]|uniref:Tachykinin family protein n=1 Tax=Periconia macrospinosa TaxID=97972 RepID=A0A2V1E4L4_9PLEO|nr:hypothetical protein DM02DRAFT_625013 [Periconia macrospinosa]
MDKSAKTVFNFVNLTHPNELKDEETQLRIRRLAMTEFGRTRRKPKTKREKNEIVFEIREPPAEQPPVPIERFGAGAVDPFTAYPIELDDTSRELVAFIFRDNSTHSRQLRGSWYPVGLADKVSFHNLLSNSRLYMLQELTGSFFRQDDVLSLSHHNTALRLMAEKMNDPKQHDSDEMLASVSSFMAHHLQHVLGTFLGWEQHRSALARVVQLRGGIDFITDENLRITISWCDLIGSFSQDIPSIVPMPHKWKNDANSPPGSPRQPCHVSLAWKKELPMMLEWITIFDDIAQLISLDRALREKDFQRAATSGSWMEPTIFRLLAFRPLHRGTEREDVIEEVCRLGTMLFLAPIWRWLGAAPVWTNCISQNLLSVLSNHMIEWGGLKCLLLWTLYFAAIETQDSREKSQYSFILAVLMNGSHIDGWHELMEIVKDVLWVEQVFASSDEGIRDEVLRILQMQARNAMVETEDE